MTTNDVLRKYEVTYVCTPPSPYERDYPGYTLYGIHVLASTGNIALGTNQTYLLSKKNFKKNDIVEFWDSKLSCYYKENNMTNTDPYLFFIDRSQNLPAATPQPSNTPAGTQKSHHDKLWEEVMRSSGHNPSP